MRPIFSLFSYRPRLRNPHQVRFNRLAKLLESPIERVFWVTGYNRLSKVGKFIPQVKIGQYRVDFALTDIPNAPQVKIAIELDGHDYHSSPDQLAYDTQRDRDFLKDGWLTIRFTGSQVNGDCPKCVREVVDTVRVWVRLLNTPR